MTVDMLETGIILVTLAQSDMTEYTLDFSDKADIDDVRKGLGMLLRRVREICGLERGRCSYLVEALPAREGCMLVISVHTARRRKVYRIKRASQLTVCVFYDIDAMLDYISSGGNGAGCTVYFYDEEYILIPEAYTAAALRELSEYGRLNAVSRVTAARLREYGKVVYSRRGNRRRYLSDAI